MYAFGEDDHGDGDDNKEDADGQIECERFAEDEYTNEDGGNGLHSSNTAVSVPPILWTASTRVIFEMTVGTIARSIRLTSDIVSGIGCIPSLVLALMENRMVLTMNT